MSIHVGMEASQVYTGVQAECGGCGVDGGRHDDQRRLATFHSPITCADWIAAWTALRRVYRRGGRGRLARRDRLARQ